MSRKRDRDESEDTPQNKRHRFESPQEEVNCSFIREQFPWGIKRLMALYIVDPSDALFLDVVVSDLGTAKWLFDVVDGADGRWIDGQKTFKSDWVGVKLSTAATIEQFDWYVEKIGFRPDYESIPWLWTWDRATLSDTVMPNLGQMIIDRAAGKVGPEFYLKMAVRAIDLDDAQLLRAVSVHEVVQVNLFNRWRSEKIQADFFRLIYLSEFPTIPILEVLRQLAGADEFKKLIVRDLVRLSFIHTCLRAQDKETIVEFAKFAGLDIMNVKCDDVPRMPDRWTHPLDILLKCYFDHQFLKKELVELVSELCPIPPDVFKRISGSLRNFKTSRGIDNIRLTFCEFDW